MVLVIGVGETGQLLWTVVHVAVRCQVLNVRIEMRVLAFLAQIVPDAIAHDRRLGVLDCLLLVGRPRKWHLVIFATGALHGHHILQDLVYFATLVALLFEVVAYYLSLQAVDVVLGRWPRRLQPGSVREAALALLVSRSGDAGVGELQAHRLCRPLGLLQAGRSHRGRLDHSLLELALVLVAVLRAG